jgi:hypothetical protein
VGLLEKRQSPRLPIRATEYSALNIPLPAYDVALEVKLLPGKREIVVQMVFSRDRGRRMFAELESDRLVLDQEFLEPSQWSEGKSLKRFSIKHHLPLEFRTASENPAP